MKKITALTIEEALIELHPLVKEVNLMRTRKWSQNNRDKMNAYQRKYYLKNKDKIILDVLKYQKRYKGRCKKYQRKYYLKNKDKFKGYYLKKKLLEAKKNE